LDQQATALNGAAMTWQRHGDRWWSTSRDDAGLELELFDDRARIRAWSAEFEDSSRVDRDDGGDDTMSLALHVAICESLRARGLVPLHAAVIEREGRATALLGPSGVGKSTTLLSAIDAGWRAVAEDFAWLDPAECLIQGWRGEQGVRIRPDGMSHIPASRRSAPWRVERDGKLLLGYDDLSPRRRGWARLTRVTVLHRDPSRDSALEALEALGLRDATRALWESAGVPLCRVSRARFAAAVPALLSQLEWRRLVLGRGAPTL
jgi:hypothetical protein